MRDQHYKNKTLRISDEAWERLKNSRMRSGKTWNMFILFLIKLSKEYRRYEKKKHL